MLHELEHVRQVTGEPLRRWFSGPGMDLIVWHQNEHISGFQFCYLRDDKSYALTWLRHRDFSYDLIDDGDLFGRGGKMTPICIPDGAPDTEYVYGLFIRASPFIEAQIRHFIARTLRRHPRRPEPSTWSRAG